MGPSSRQGDAADRKNDGSKQPKVFAELKTAESSEDLIRLMSSLREFGSLASGGEPLLEKLMLDHPEAEVRFHATVTFAVVCEKTEDNWQRVVNSINGGNQQVLLISQTNPVPMLAALSTFPTQSFATLRYAALRAELSFDEELLNGELAAKKLDTVVGPDNGIRASACLALGNIPSSDSRDVVLATLRAAEAKLNGRNDLLTMEACLIALGQIGIGGDKVSAGSQEVREEQIQSGGPTKQGSDSSEIRERESDR